MSIFKRSALGFSLVACATLMLPVFTGTANAANAAPGALIRNYQSGKCLDADANFLGYNGDRVQLWTCNGGANQKWLPIPDNPNVKNQVILENAADGKLLDADANSVNNNGGKVQLWDWWGGANQIWQG